MKRVILLLVLILLICLAYSFAAVPCKINYQGRLIKDNVPVNGTVNMEFKLYDQPTEGNLKKTISLSSVPVYNGLFRVVLDLASGIDWAAGQMIYLEVKVGSDILTPREELSAYPYAINSHLLEGKTTDYFLNTSGETQKKDGGLNIMGNVGIGTTSPGKTLDVAGNSMFRGYTYHTDGSVNALTAPLAGDNKFYLVTTSNHQLSFGTNNVWSRMVIDTTGNVGIGTTSPQSPAPNAQSGNIDVNDIYLRNGNKWLSQSLQSWESNWIAVQNKKVYVNGGVDAKGNTINLNHNLGSSSVLIQVLYAKDSGTFPSSPNLNTITYNTAHSDSNVDWRSVHGGVLVQGIKANSIDKLVTGHENVAIWADDPISWDGMREPNGWVKIILLKVGS